jgi:small subunit ribosomal protein S26e
MIESAAETDVLSWVLVRGKIQFSIQTVAFDTIPSPFHAQSIPRFPVKSSGHTRRRRSFLLTTFTLVSFSRTGLVRLIMTVKRRNHGRNKHGRGRQACPLCVHGKAIPKDKAIKRFIVTTLWMPHSLRDIKEASAYQEYQLPKLYLKMYYCVETAVHQRIVRGRSKEQRRVEPLLRVSCANKQRTV